MEIVEVMAVTRNSRLRMRSRFYQSGDDDFHRGPSTHQPAQSLKISLKSDGKCRSYGRYKEIHVCACAVATISPGAMFFIEDHSHPNPYNPLKFHQNRTITSYSYARYKEFMTGGQTDRHTDRQTRNQNCSERSKTQNASGNFDFGELFFSSLKSENKASATLVDSEAKSNCCFYLF